MQPSEAGRDHSGAGSGPLHHVAHVTHSPRLPSPLPQAVLRWETFVQGVGVLGTVAVIMAAWPPLAQHRRAEKDRRAAKALVQAELATKVDALGTTVNALGTKVDALGTTVNALGTKVDALGTKVDSLGWKLDCLLVGVAVALTKVCL